MAGSTCIKGSGWIKKLDAWKTIKDWGLPKHPVPPMGVITLTGYKPVENFSWFAVTSSFTERGRFRIKRFRHRNSMSWWLLKFNSKLTLNKTKEKLSINKAKSALLTHLKFI